MKYVAFGNGTSNEFSTASSTIYGHTNAAGAETVGAAFYGETPEFGVVPGYSVEIRMPSTGGGTPHVRVVSTQTTSLSASSNWMPLSPS